MFSNKTLLITGDTGTFGNAVLRRFLATEGRGQRAVSLFDAMIDLTFVCHTAALKQAPSCEFYPMEALPTNSQSARNVTNTLTPWSVARE